MDRGHRRRGREPRSLDRGGAATEASEGNRQSPSQSPPSREREREQSRVRVVTPQVSVSCYDRRLILISDAQ